MGHSVVGVEISEKAILQFFTENNMTYSEEALPSLPGAKVYKSSERNISLYQCGLFNFSSSIESQFGAIWDRSALVDINPRDREKLHLLDTLLYNPELYQGPPFIVPDEQVASLFGNSCDVKRLQSYDVLTDKQRVRYKEYLTKNVHLISPKSI